MCGATYWVPRLSPRGLSPHGLSPRRLSPREDDDVRDFRHASLARGEPLFPGVTFFPVHRELLRVFTDNLCFKSADGERHTDRGLYG